MSTAASNVLRFFQGENLNSIIGRGNKTIEQVYNYDENELEDDHAFIQWVFPTPRSSAYNGDAPVLTIYDIIFLRTNPLIIDWLNKFKDKMFAYWGINPVNVQRSFLLNGHNGLRLSRAIECLTLFGIDISYALTVVNQLIEKNYLNPYYDNYQGRRYPVWFIRYFESNAIVNQT